MLLVTSADGGNESNSLHSTGTAVLLIENHVGKQLLCVLNRPLNKWLSPLVYSLQPGRY